MYTDWGPASGVTGLRVLWGTLVVSVVIFVVVSLGAGIITRWWLLRRGWPGGVETLANRLTATSVIGLVLTAALATVVCVMTAAPVWASHEAIRRHALGASQLRRTPPQ